jgi:hypothetical protein
MIKKLKDILGIEGVKIDMMLPEDFDLSANYIEGEVLLTSQADKIVQGLEIKLIEKYKRGKKDAMLVNEYTLGHIKLDLLIPILANQEEHLEFKLPYNRMLSEMDKYEKTNFLGNLIVPIAKKLKGVKSEFRVEATAYIKGTKLHPTITKSLVV